MTGACAGYQEVFRPYLRAGDDGQAARAPCRRGRAGECTELEYEAVNAATALWTRARSDVSDDEYKEFYKHVSHDFEDPLTWSHNKVEGKLEYTSLLYLPKKAPVRYVEPGNVTGAQALRAAHLYHGRGRTVSAYVPAFVKGVVDSNDLSLNVSREILQQDPAVDSMRSALTKRVLDMLAKLAKQGDDYRCLLE